MLVTFEGYIKQPTVYPATLLFRGALKAGSEINVMRLPVTASYGWQEQLGTDDDAREDGAQSLRRCNLVVGYSGICVVVRRRRVYRIIGRPKGVHFLRSNRDKWVHDVRGARCNLDCELKRRLPFQRQNAGFCSQELVQPSRRLVCPGLFATARAQRPPFISQPGFSEAP